MKTVIRTFELVKDGKNYGTIRWIRQRIEPNRGLGDDYADHGRLEGTAAAVAQLQATIARALAEGWGNACGSARDDLISAPLDSVIDMACVLEQGGFDVPDWLQPYTIAAWLENIGKMEEAASKDGIAFNY